MADEGKTGEEQEKAAQEEDEIKVMAKPRAEVFEVAFGDEQPKKNLQEAFLRYRRKLQKEVKKSRKRRDVADENRLRAMADPDNMWRLRMKFLDQARKYFGVPYAKKYWTDQDPEFRSRWFLDCCGLVRRCMRDLKKDFGFKIGPWNQAYMYDTLPHTILESQVKPGDLVFISAIYHSPKKKKQRHNITHVEIMTGEGPQTIGSRWNKGHVQIFDSYRFKPEAYHSEQYIFKSLDTWLMGICRSFCREHRWRTRAETFKPGKHSVFSVPEQQQNKQNQQADENASDSSDETVMLTSRSEGIVAKTPSQVLGSKDSNQGVISQQLQDKGSIGEEGSSMDERSDDEEDEDDEDDQDVDAIHQSESETEDDCPQRPATSTGTYNVRQTDNMVEKIKDDQKVTQDVLKVDELNKTQEDSSCDISNVLSNLELNDNSARVLEHNKPNSDDHSQASFDSRNTYTKNSDNNEQEVANLNNNNNLNDERSKAEDEAEHLKWLEEETNINANNNTSGSSTPQDGDVREKQAAGTTQGARKGQPSPGERPPWNDSVFDTTAAARRRDKKPTAIESARARTANLAAPKDPLFYIGGNNGNALVETPLLELGWRKISSKYADNYKLRWVECKSAINYNAFKEGLQMVNRIPNCHLLTNKLGLLNSLQRYERVQTSINPSRQSKICSADFLPETYRLDDAIDRKTFFDTYRDNNSNDLWICKPCGMNQGKGIYIVRDLHDFEKTMEEREENLKKSHRPMERIIQRYIMHPMLLEDRKFDIRAYMLIASTVPYFVLYHKGYVRLCLYPYDAKEHSLTAHLTNQFIQKKDKDYNKNKESTVWSMDRFNEYFNKHIAEEKGVEKDWVYTVLTPRMKQIMHYCFNAVKHKLRCRHGYFDLYGLDFMVDQDLNVSLIEVNVNPCLSTNCEALKDVIPDVVREGLFIAIECFDKTKRNQSLLPLQSLKNYQIIYASSSTPRHPSSTARGSPTHAGSQSRPRSLSPLQARSRSLSPTKDTPSSSSPHRSLSPNHSSSRTRHSLSPTHSQTRNSLPKIETRKHREFLPLPPPPPPRSLSIMVPHSMNLTPASVGLESSSSSSSTSFPEASNEVRFKLTHNGSDNELPPPTFKPAVAQPKTSTTTSQQDSIVSTTTSYQVTSSATLQSPMVVSSPFKLAATVKKTNNSGNVGTSASLFKLNSPPPKDSSTPSKLLTASSSALVTSIPSALRFNRPKTPSRAPSPIDKLQLALNIAKKNERGS